MVKLNPATASGQRPAPAGTARQATLRQADLRQANLRLLTALVCAADEPPSRADLAASTGMTRSTASRLVDELVAAGLLEELSPATANGRGRPAVPLVAARGGPAAIGMEVTASRLVLRLVDLSGAVLTERTEDADLVGSEPGGTLRRLADLLSEMHRSTPAGVRVVGTGLALPGLIEPGPNGGADGARRLLAAPNLGWHDVVPELLIGPKALFGGALHLGNEADLAARAIAQERPGRPGPHRDFIHVSAEVGIGGSIVLDGKALSGRHGWAGEIGHLSVDPAGPSCRCGSRGCLERYAGRHALREAAGVDPDLPTQDLSALAHAGHRGVAQALERAGHALGVALADAVNLLDIPTVVLGGDLALLLEDLRPTITRELDRRVLAARWSPPTLTAVGGENLAATGAALLVLQGVLDDPAGHVATGPG